MSFCIAKTNFHFDGFTPQEIRQFKRAVASIELSSNELALPYYRDLTLSRLRARGDGTSEGGLFHEDGQPVAEATVLRQGEGVVVGTKQSPRATEIQTYKRAIYGGVLFSGFGHIILESAARLWAASQIPDLPILFQTADSNDAGKATLLVLADMFGIPTHRIRFTSGDAQIARAYVPEPGFVLGRKINSNYHHFVQKALSSGFDSSGDPIQRTFLSRAGLDWRQRKAIGERELERALADRDYEVVRPETLSLTNQLRLFNQCSSVAGFIGSQFHSMFLRSSEKPINVLYLCSARPNVNFFQIDLLFEGNRYYSNVANYDPAFEFGNRAPFHFQQDKIRHNLEKVGITISEYAEPNTGEFLFHWALSYFYFKVFRSGVVSGTFENTAEKRIALLMKGIRSDLPAADRQQILNAFVECARRYRYSNDEEVQVAAEKLANALGLKMIDGSAEPDAANSPVKA